MVGVSSHAGPAPDAERPSGVTDVRIAVGLGVAPSILASMLFVAISVPIAFFVISFSNATGVARGAIVGGCTGAISGVFVGRTLAWWAARRFQRQMLYIPPSSRDKSDDRLARQAALLDALEQVAKSCGVNAMAAGGKANALCRCALELVRAGAQGKAIRLATIPLDPVGPPIDVPFEPVPLRDIRPGFVDLRGGRVSAGERLRGFLFQLEQLHAGRRWVYRTVVAATILGLLVILLQTLWAIPALTPGRAAREFLLIAIPVVCVLGWFGARKLRVDRWHLVPGGLIVINPRIFAPWTARLLRREECVLLCMTQVNQVAVAHADGFVDRQAVSLWELDVLLRAWRSPLPPPSDELVQSLVKH